MKTIGIKLADGSFYPVLQEGKAGEAKLDLTTAHNNQTRVMVDLYRSSTSSMEDAEYVDTLQIDHLKEHPNGEPNISFVVSIDENRELSARIVDPETGAQSDTNITLVSRTLEERLVTDNYDISKQEEPVFEEPALEPEVISPEPVVEETPEAEESVDENPIEETEEAPVEEEPEVVDNFEPEIAETAVGGGLLATAMAMQDKEEPAIEDELVLPNFGEDISEDKITEEVPDFSNDPLPSFDDFEAPAEEYQLPIDDTSDNINFDIPDVETTIFDNDDDDFDLDSILDAEQSDESLPADTGLTDGLYDENGDFTSEDDDFTEEEEEEVSKKTRTPVIICILCAIICLVATALILFVIPSKYNLLGKTKAETEVVEALPEPAPAPVVEEKQPEPVIPSAVEDEIIVIEKAEEVLPEPPAPPKVEPEDITYKIKWGDTLWDIADTYYKNPWRYHKIAKYNGIKDPDYIISGTIIKIPVE